MKKDKKEDYRLNEFIGYEISKDDFTEKDTELSLNKELDMEDDLSL